MMKCTGTDRTNHPEVCDFCCDMSWQSLLNSIFSLKYKHYLSDPSFDYVISFVIFYVHEMTQSSFHFSVHCVISDMGTTSKNFVVDSKTCRREKHDKENNEAPEEIKIVKSELNDSFEPDLSGDVKMFPATSGRRVTGRRKNPKKSNSTALARNMGMVSTPPLKSMPMSCNTHIRYDDNGDPVLNLRPMFGIVGPNPNPLIQAQDSKAKVTSIEDNGSSKEEEPFTLVRSNPKRKKRLQKLDSNGSESEVVGTKVIRSSTSLSSSPTDSVWFENQRNQEQNPRISKYWAQRYRLFSKYDQGIQMDEESW